MNAEVGKLNTVCVEADSAFIEGFGSILVGLGFALVLSWPIVICIFLVAPLMLLSSKVGTAVKRKQWGILSSEESADKEAEIMLSDAIVNFKTVASIANSHILVEEFDGVNSQKAKKEIKATSCEAVQYGFSQFI